jgi:hypothetical protein
MPFQSSVAVHRLAEVRRWSADQWPVDRPLISMVPDIETERADTDTALDRLSPRRGGNPESESPAPPGRAELSGLLRLVLEVLDRRRPERQLEDWLPVGERRMLLQEAETAPAGRWRLRSLRPSLTFLAFLIVRRVVLVGAGVSITPDVLPKRVIDRR